MNELEFVSPQRRKSPKIIVPKKVKTALLNKHTCYIIKVNDFGREYELERRYDDFSNLHGFFASLFPAGLTY